MAALEKTNEQIKEELEAEFLPEFENDDTLFSVLKAALKGQKLLTTQHYFGRKSGTHGYVTFAYDIDPGIPGMARFPPRKELIIKRIFVNSNEKGVVNKTCDALLADEDVQPHLTKIIIESIQHPEWVPSLERQGWTIYGDYTLNAFKKKTGGKKSKSKRKTVRGSQVLSQPKRKTAKPIAKTTRKYCFKISYNYMDTLRKKTGGKKSKKKRKTVYPKVKTLKGGVNPFDVDKLIGYDKPGGEEGKININSVNGRGNCVSNALLLLGVISETNTDLITFLTEEIGIFEKDEEGELEEIKAVGMSPYSLLLILNRTYKQHHVYNELNNEIMEWLLPGYATIGTYSSFPEVELGHAFVVINHNNALYIADLCNNWFGPMHSYFTKMDVPHLWKRHVVRSKSPYPPDIFITQEIIFDTIAQRARYKYARTDNLIYTMIDVPPLSMQERQIRHELLQICLESRQIKKLLTEATLERAKAPLERAEAPLERAEAPLEKAEAAEGGRKTKNLTYFKIR